MSNASTHHAPTTTLNTQAFDRYKELLGDEWDAFIASLHEPLPLCLWTNTTRLSVEEMQTWLERCELADIATPLSWHEGAWRVPAVEDRPLGTLLPYLTGLYHLQEEVSLIPGYMLAPRPHERVLDTCAAPGGKTAQLAIQMQNTGTVVANDRSHGRLRAMRSIIDRLGLLNVSMSHYNAANFPRDMGTFDRVLVDVPCSCEGTSRKNRRVLESIQHFDFDNQSRLQTAILRRGLDKLRPGGTLAYSTCTYAPEENERVVHQALEDAGREEFELLHPPKLEGFVTSPGLTQWRDERYGDDLTRCMRIWPHQNDTGGFFIALIARRPTQEPT
jgi:NOL1/NOP2/sun family putative RNA methylase